MCGRKFSGSLQFDSKLDTPTLYYVIAFGHRAESCPDPCFACGGDHSYLFCSSLEARDRAAKNRAQWHGGRQRKVPLSGAKVREGTEWEPKSWDPKFDPPSPGKREYEQVKADYKQSFQGVSLRSLFQASRLDLCNDLAAWHYLVKPGACSICSKEPVYNDGRWMCSGSCRAIRHSVFKDSVFCSGEKEVEDDNLRVKLDVYEAASFIWCFAHEVDPFATAAITGIAIRTVKKWVAIFRDMVRVKEKVHQECISFTSEGCANGFCHVQGVATRIRKSHRRDQNNAIRSTTHCSALFKQQNSLKAVVRPVPQETVAVGSDGKPGAPPPERDELVYDMALSFCIRR